MLLTKTVAQAERAWFERAKRKRERGRAKRLIFSQGKSIACFCDNISEPQWVGISNGILQAFKAIIKSKERFRFLK
jgi:hypothetical protein